MAENITTLLDKLDALNISLADFLYLVQGTGPERDRKMSLEQLRDFIQEKITELYLSGTNSSVDIKAAGVSLAAGANQKNNVNAEGSTIENGSKKNVTNAEGSTITDSGLTVKFNKDGFSIASPGGSVTLSKTGLTITDSNGNTVSADGAGVTANRITSVLNLAGSAVKVADSGSYNLTTYDGAVGDIVLVRSNSASDTAVQITYNYQESGYKSCVLKPGCALAFYLKTFVKSEIRGIEFAEFVPVSNVTITTNN